MECELGAESFRPRWGQWGGEGFFFFLFFWRGTNSRLCCTGCRHCDLPSSPSSLRSDSRPVRPARFWLPTMMCVAVQPERRVGDHRNGLFFGGRREAGRGEGSGGALTCAKCLAGALQGPRRVSAPAVGLCPCHAGGLMEC